LGNETSGLLAKRNTLLSPETFREDDSFVCFPAVRKRKAAAALQP
jgi:hypothetical protein